ncbi:MAG: hypothetical protein GY800_03465 [Planctomycetes bacterium]|nr:hypothetical protein [Planctomycetota bacterium]
MPNEEDVQENLPVPKEIPWQLAATTRVLRGDSVGYTGSSISIFTCEPELNELKKDYPDDKLVYFKFTVSLASDRQAMQANMAKDASRLLFQGGLPIWTSVFDASLLPRPWEEGGFRPYFISASPIRRTMLETGVIGVESFEGESGGMAVGSSGSAIHESFATNTTTSSSSSSAFGGVGAILGPVALGIGGSTSGRKTTTGVSGGRDVTQLVDMTSRQASEERRELFSHLSNVSNVLSLLTTHYVGSPFLRFTLRPRPLRHLSIDPTEPSLWFTELQRRRSSGLEGIQDFYAVAVVPRKMKKYCVNVYLRNLYVIDNPPTPPDPRTPPSDMEVRTYLNSVYPLGTPLGELDVDVLNETRQQMLPVPGGFLMTPVVLSWDVDRTPWDLHGTVWVWANYVGRRDSDITKQRFRDRRRWYPYKTRTEARLDAARARYEAELARSPLERGAVVWSGHPLDVCFEKKEEKKYDTINVDVGDATTGMVPIDYRDMKVDATHAVHGRLDSNKSSGSWYTWNAFEEALAAQASGIGDWGEEGLQLDNPRVLDVILRQVEKLEPDDPANQSLNRARSWLKLSARDCERLRKAGVTDLRGLARTINQAESIEKINHQREELSEQLKQEPVQEEMPERIYSPFSADSAKALRLVIGKRLRDKAGLGDYTQAPGKRPRKKARRKGK